MEVIQRLFKKNNFLLLLFAFIITGFIPAMVSAQEVIQHRVLFISSYSYAWETVPEQIEGIQKAFPDDVQLDYKFMDTKNCTSEESNLLFYESMKQYLSEVPAYDALIVGDDAAFQFAMDYQDELFPEIPIVYEGVNDINLATKASQNEWVCGIVEKLSYENTLSLATKLYPNARRIVAVLDDTITGVSERTEFYKYKESFPQLDFDEINTSTLTQKELIHEISSLNRDSILVYVMCSEDADGNKYVGSQGIELISSSARIPTFSIVSIGMGHGILGGEIVSQKEMGRLAGDMVQQYFNGTDFSTFEVEMNSPKTFRFDENVMRKYNISAEKLPENSEFINHTPTFWEENIAMIRISLVIGIILILILCGVIAVAVHQHQLNNKLAKAQYSLKNAAKIDHLTGLNNRSVFMEVIHKKIENGDKFALVLYDIDHFKEINDTLGHNNGDIVLKELSMRTVRLCDKKLSIYRLAGDEFTAIIDSEDKEEITKYVEQIQGAFKQPFLLEKKEYAVHSSIGVALYPTDAETQTDLVVAADNAMYSVKNNGRNAYAFYQKN